LPVDITRNGNQLVITVCDDGVGGVDPLHGLTALRDRVASLSGTLTVTSPPSGGTSIQAVL
jgi:signal transduction histidine kinase